MRTINANATAETALAALRERYVRENPASQAGHLEATRTMPGGNTRTVLHFDPFPLTMVRGEGAVLWDADGHAYVDGVGEFSAGLYGHSDPVIRAAIQEALDGGIVMAAPTRYERELAAAITARFPAVERLRFCNSGTEASMLALMTARLATGRERIMVFREAYHGGVFKFGSQTALNLPLDWLLADYNDVEGTAALIRQHGSALAAVIVEPILGAAGNIPGSEAFLRMLRKETAACGALLIFDEVKTSRTGPGGVQGEWGIAPDMTVFGKYLGGGLSSGVFGGRQAIMARFDPASPNAVAHAGTFNNNVCSMAAGLAGLTRVYTAERARAFLAGSERFRQDLEASFRAADLPMRAVGWGSLITIHLAPGPVTSPRDLHPAGKTLGRLLHLYCLLEGVLLSARGDLVLSLAMTEAQQKRIAATLLAFGEGYAPLLRRELGV